MIYLIMTACLTTTIGVYDKETRKEQYRKSIMQTLSVLPEGIHPIIVENNDTSFSVLDELGVDVMYTDTNVKNPYRKAANELEDIKRVVSKYQIKEQDWIIKLTGRYAVQSDSFFQKVLTLRDSHVDALVKFFNVCTQSYMENDCVLGMFAIRCHHLLRFSYDERYITSCEVQFASFIRKYIPSDKLLEIKDLGLWCIFAEDYNTLLV